MDEKTRIRQLTEETNRLLLLILQELRKGILVHPSEPLEVNRDREIL